MYPESSIPRDSVSADMHTTLRCAKCGTMQPIADAKFCFKCGGGVEKVHEKPISDPRSNHGSSTEVDPAALKHKIDAGANDGIFNRLFKRHANWIGVLVLFYAIFTFVMPIAIIENTSLITSLGPGIMFCAMMFTAMLYYRIRIWAETLPMPEQRRVAHRMALGPLVMAIGSIVSTIPGFTSLGLLVALVGTILLFCYIGKLRATANLSRLGSIILNIIHKLFILLFIAQSVGVVMWLMIDFSRWQDIFLYPVDVDLQASLFGAECMVEAMVLFAMSIFIFILGHNGPTTTAQDMERAKERIDSRCGECVAVRRWLVINAVMYLIFALNWVDSLLGYYYQEVDSSLRETLYDIIMSRPWSVFTELVRTNSIGFTFLVMMLMPVVLLMNRFINRRVGYVLGIVVMMLYFPALFFVEMYEASYVSDALLMQLPVCLFNLGVIIFVLSGRISAFAKLLLCFYMFFRSAYFCFVAYNGVILDYMLMNAFVDVVLNLAGVVVFLVAYLSHEAERMPTAQLQD